MATLAATDSFRLVERKIPIIPIQETFTLLVPMRTVQELIRISGSFPNEEDVEMEISEQQVLFKVGNLEMYSRLLAGAFVKYGAIIPTTFIAKAGVTTSELVQALRLSTVFSQSGVANVMIEITEDGNFSLTSYGSQKGTTKHTVYAILDEGFVPVKVALNAKFLLDACTASNSPHLQLAFSGATTALVITAAEPDYIQLVMPIRLDS
jgi:DNA polymerase-3 subunit beta